MKLLKLKGDIGLWIIKYLN